MTLDLIRQAIVASPGSAEPEIYRQCSSAMTQCYVNKKFILRLGVFPRKVIYKYNKSSQHVCINS